MVDEIGRGGWRRGMTLVLLSLLAAGCATGPAYHDPNMDFASVRSVAVLPFANLSRETAAGERVRDVFSLGLLATGVLYVVPGGEVTRALAKTGVSNPVAPSSEELVRLGALLKAEALITGVVREYGEIRSGSAAANAISVSVQMIETQTGRVVWTASSTKGGIGIADRLLGGGGKPMNDVTQEAVDELLRKLLE